MNLLNGNSFYIDTVYSTSDHDLARKSTLVAYVTITATSANAILVLGDIQASAQNKLELRVAAAGTTEQFSFEQTPVLFPNGIRVLTLTNCTATCIIKNVGG